MFTAQFYRHQLTVSIDDCFVYSNSLFIDNSWLFAKQQLGLPHSTTAVGMSKVLFLCKQSAADCLQTTAEYSMFTLIQWIIASISLYIFVMFSCQTNVMVNKFNFLNNIQQYPFFKSKPLNSCKIISTLGSQDIPGCTQHVPYTNISLARELS